jgi:hypothetical protein
MKKNDHVWEFIDVMHSSLSQNIPLDPTAPSHAY